MEVRNVDLRHTAVSPSQYPEDGIPELAFVGRSNVGKSSLINKLVNRKSLARTSQNPGKTRTINFYAVENMLYFVDLPGYGYAKVSKSESEKWGKMIEKYLIDRKELKGIVFLVDIRHEPSANDIMMYNWLKHYGHSHVVVATKQDKISNNALNKNLSVIRKTLNIENEILLPFSTELPKTKDNLWSCLEKLCGFDSSFEGGDKSGGQG